jgi:superfamily II DNA helicase RecQ
MSLETNEISRHRYHDEEDDDMVTLLEVSECETLDHDETTADDVHNHVVTDNMPHVTEGDTAEYECYSNPEILSTQKSTFQEEMQSRFFKITDTNKVDPSASIEASHVASVPTQIPTESELLACMRKYWQYDSFRTHQLEVCQAVLQGRDSFYMDATGSGKCLVFQLPTITLAERGEKVCTIVISPLISLMQDQVLNLLDMNIKACMIEKTSSAFLRKVVFEKGKVNLIYLSPEMAMISKDSLIALRKVVKIVCCAIDECHCVSEWGIGFRPEYSQLGDLRDILGIEVPFVALTASATKFCKNDVCSSLRMRDPLVIRNSINRPNIKYTVKEKFTLSKFHVVEEIKCFLMQQWGLGAACFPVTVVYVMKKKLAEELATMLDNVPELPGIAVAYYHSDLPDEMRLKILQNFLDGTVNVVVATSAFGMGKVYVLLYIVVISLNAHLPFPS